MGKMKKILAYLMITLCLCEVAQNQANAVEVVQEVIRYDDGSYAEVILDVEPVEMARTSKTGTKSYVKKNSSGLVEFTYTLQTSLDKGTQRKTTENELPSLTQCTA